MSRQRLAMVAVIGAGVIGATMYIPRKNETKINDVQDRNSGTPSGPDKDPRYREVSMGDETKNLPAGGVSSGYGGGGTTASVTEKMGWKNSLLGGAGKKTASRSDEEGYHDTRGISRMGPEVPSKKRTDVSE
ncbi:hypothetical protein GGI43DRAFT_394569 [Trichoderma evansii]